MVDEALLKKLIGRMRGVVEAIRATKPDRHHLMQNYWIWPHEYPGPAARVAEITEEVRRLNPLMLHEGDIKLPIVLAILEEVAADAVDEERFCGAASAALRRLIDYEGTQELHIQLANLVVRTTFEFGGVEIRPIPNTGGDTERDLKYKGPFGYGGPLEAVNSYAAVPRAPGLGHKVRLNAVDMVEQVLTLVRAIGLPHLWGRKWLEAGIAGRAFASGWVVLRERVGPWNEAIGSGGPDQYMRLERMLRNWSAAEIAALEKIYMKRSPSRMERKVLRALLWLGEATLPADNASKFARLAIAFETAVGGEPSADDQLREIGITEMLAERTAFLLGRCRETRLSWHQAVKKLYGSRSKVMHGELDPINDDELTRWAFLVWSAVRRILGRVSEFRDVEQFARWVRSQRYTLPT